MRYFFEISYHGARYHGWQTQKNAVGVQAIVEQSLSVLLGQPTAIVGSGRTDTGVHCRQQFFHADLPGDTLPPDLLVRLNSFLPPDIAIHSIRPVQPDAHARYDARLRAYEYHITRVKDPIRMGLAYYYFRPLDIGHMNEAAACLIGHHDFQSFSKVHTNVHHFLCEVKSAHWHQHETLLVFSIEANRFLRGMVRALVGTLLEVGSGRMTTPGFQQVVAGKDRSKAGMNVPAEGLFLSRVEYPQDIFLNAPDPN